MTAWIHMFSKFTPEVLLLEFFLLFLFTCIYSVYWVMKKRRFGVIEGDLPSGPVKAYLSDLVTHTEELSVQLFGTGVSTNGSKWGIFSDPEPDEETLNKIADLERQIQEQAAILETTAQENANLSTELEKIQKNHQEAEIDKNERTRLQNAYNHLSEKIALLETRLAEYAIIEEDLADLKRYQQENLQMKELLKKNNLEFSSTLPDKPFPPIPQSSYALPPAEQATESKPSEGAPQPVTPSPEPSQTEGTTSALSNDSSPLTASSSPAQNETVPTMPAPETMTSSQESPTTPTRASTPSSETQKTEAILTPPSEQAPSPPAPLTESTSVESGESKTLEVLLSSISDKQEQKTIDLSSSESPLPILPVLPGTTEEKTLELQEGSAESVKKTPEVQLLEDFKKMLK